MDLKPGNIPFRVTRMGFEPLVRAVELPRHFRFTGSNLSSPSRSLCNGQRKESRLRQLRSAYRQLRGIDLRYLRLPENYKFNMDVGNFELKNRQLTFLAPVHGIRDRRVFVGEGHFTLKPIVRGRHQRDAASQWRSDGRRKIFRARCSRFTGRVYNQITASLVTKVATPPTAEEAFRHWKEKIRRRREVARGFTEEVLTDATIDNVDADVLSAVYNRNILNSSTPTWSARSQWLHRIRTGGNSAIGLARGSPPSST